MRKHTLNKSGIINIMILLPVLFFGSCAAKISGQLDGNGAGDYMVNVSLQPQFSRLIRSLQSLAGGKDAPLIDGALVSGSLAKAPGVASAAFKNNSPDTIDGTVKISKIGDFLASGDVPGFINFEQNPGKQGGQCVINIDRAMGPDLLTLVSPEISDYLEALMAPIATGDEMTNSDYLDAITSVYGAGVSGEISNSSIYISIDFPGPVQSVTNGAFNGRRAVFDIPLLDLLVLEKPLHYEVIW
ncbi:MAG: hypothetical protein FWF29_05105 [Treponema sp.]|nr:hypothetical protein [Treponema sp.]